MLPWEQLATANAPDGERLELRRRGKEYLILAGGYDLMSSQDDRSASALSELGCAHLDRGLPSNVLVGGLGMGYTLRAALDHTGPHTQVEVAELVPTVAEWNREHMAHLAGSPLEDERTELYLGDVMDRMRAPGSWDAILLDVDNGPDALAHKGNDGLYSAKGIGMAYRALRSGGVLGTWSFSDDSRYTDRLRRGGFKPTVHKVSASRKGRGRHHIIWISKKG